MPFLQKRYWLIVVILLTLFFILRFFPASWLIFSVQKAVPSFQVAGVSGTIWQGKADYVQWAERGHALPLGELKWQLSVFSLLTLTPCIQFSTDLGEQYLKGNICYSISGELIRGDEIETALPIANIAPFFGINLGGNISASVKSIELAQDQFANVDANLLWERASVFNGSEWLALGNIQSRFSTDSGGLSSEWRHIEEGTSASPLKMNVRVDIVDALAKTPVIKVKGFMKPNSRNSGLNPMLQFIGNKNNDGSYDIDFTE
jgi:general secretion pathway protein N